MKTLIKILCLSMLWFSCESSTEPENVNGCTNETACNFNPDANFDDSSCIYELDECGECGGDGVDADNDGICDDVDDCIGFYDCNGTCADFNYDGWIDQCGTCEGEEPTYIYLWGECYNIEGTTEIDLHSSELAGGIPPEIGNLTNLTNLNLSENQLTGEIPPEIGNLINLEYLSLSNNQLTGEIIPDIGNLTNLEDLYLAYNQFTGEIPSEICNYFSGNSDNFNVSNNQLCPTYPDCVSQADIDSQDTSNCP